MALVWRRGRAPARPSERERKTTIGRRQDGVRATLRLTGGGSIEKQKTFWEVCVRRNRMPGKLAATFIALLGIAKSAAATVAAKKQGGTLRLYHKHKPPSASLLEEYTI